MGQRNHVRCHLTEWVRQKNPAKWLASTVCSSWNAVWFVWTKPLLESQNVNQADNHYINAFCDCYLGQPDPWPWFQRVVILDPGAVSHDLDPLLAFDPWSHIPRHNPGITWLTCHCLFYLEMCQQAHRFAVRTCLKTTCKRWERPHQTDF